MLFLSLILCVQNPVVAAPAEEEPVSQPAAVEASSLQAEALVENAASAPVTQNKAVASPAPAKVTKRTAVSAAINADQAALTGNSGKKWSVNASFTTSAGLATFLTDPTASRYVGSSLQVAPAYVFRMQNGFAVRVSANESVFWEYTPPNEPNGRRFDWSDLILGASARAYTIPKANIDLWASYRMPAPISLYSIQAGLVTAMIPGVGASRNFNFNAGKQPMSITIRYDFVLRKNFHTTTVPRFNVGQQSDVLDPSIVSRSTDVLINGGVARGGASTDYTFTNGLTISWSPIEVLSFTVFASLTNGFTYAIADSRDQFTSPYAVSGPGRFDSLRTNIDVTWTMTPQLLLSGGIFTAQPPFRLNNQGLYNPIINVEAAASNYTSFYLSLTALL